MKEAKKSFKVAFCGVMSALGVALLSLAGLIPILTYAAPMYVGLLIIPSMIEGGNAGAWCVWFVTGVLSALISPDKEATAFYLFVGYYPIVKSAFDKIKLKPVRIAVKLAFFTASIVVMYLLLIYLLRLESVIEEFREASMIINISGIVIMIAVMMVFDLLIDRMRILYVKKIRPKLRLRV